MPLLASDSGRTSPDKDTGEEALTPATSRSSAGHFDDQPLAPPPRFGRIAQRRCYTPLSPPQRLLTA